MNANELRIGNYFLESYEGYKIIAGINHHNDLPITVDAHAIGRKICGRYDLDAMQPILLTEDILLKCGFVKGVLWSEMRIHSNLRFYSDFDETVCHLFDRSDNNLAECKYLHQLQNLFFCLCGKELTIKL